MEREQVKESLREKSYDELLEMHGPVLNRLEELIDIRATGVKGTDDEFGTLRTKDAVISELLWEKAMEESGAGPSELPRMFMAHQDRREFITVEIYWKDLTPAKRMEIGQQIANADAYGVNSDEVYKLSEEEMKEILSDSYENWDVFPMASFEIGFDNRETADLEEE